MIEFDSTFDWSYDTLKEFNHEAQNEKIDQRHVGSNDHPADLKFKINIKVSDFIHICDINHTNACNN